MSGVSRGNPGLSGAGVVIRDRQGRVLEQSSRYLGLRTPTQADYHALLDGLTAARRRNPSHLTVVVGNEALWRQILGKSTLRSPEVIDLYAQAIELIKQASDTHIELETDSALELANRLANVAVDSRGRRQAVD